MHCCRCAQDYNNLAWIGTCIMRRLSARQGFLPPNLIAICKIYGDLFPSTTGVMDNREAGSRSFATSTTRAGGSAIDPYPWASEICGHGRHRYGGLATRGESSLCDY